MTTVTASADTVTAGGMNPDSVWVRPSYEKGTMHCQLDYSVDKQHWTHVDLNIFDSDYGPWGAEKKLYNVVLRYDGKKYRAEFTPSPKDNPQVAVTESDNLYLWKPQSYPRYEQEAFNLKLKELKAEAQDNMIRIPYSDLKMVLLKAAAAKGNAAMEQENFVQTSVLATDKLAEKSFSATSGWKQQKAVLVAKADAESAQLEIIPQQAGEVQLDMVSLFPQDTRYFKLYDMA